MSKASKTNTVNTNSKTKKMEEIMKSAEVNIEVKNPTEEKKVRIRHSFNDSILLKIDSRAKELNEEDYKPIRDKIASALDELQKIIDENREFIRTERALKYRLASFSKEQIENYLKHLN